MQRTTYLPGVGYVPSGPQSYFTSPQHSMSPRYPDNIKQEEAEDGSLFLPAAEFIGYINDIKRETSPGPAAFTELSPDYRNEFARMFEEERRSRSDEIDSRGHGQRQRQDSSDITRRRSDATRSSRPTHSRSRSRNRSRSPDRSLRSRISSESQRVSSRRASRRTSSRQTSSPVEDVEADARCRCPIAIYCRIRHTDLLDCRPLVREYRNWSERRDEEAFESHRQATSAGERFVTIQDLLDGISAIHAFVAATDQNRDSAVAGLRSWILQMEDVTVTTGSQQATVTQQIVPALSSFLAPVNAATRRAKNLPAYIEEELTVLERKWTKGDFSGDVKRGLITVTTYDVNGFPVRRRQKVDKNWPFHVNAKYFGAGDLVNGQIWESRVELQRDGVHAPPIAGISGTASEGARSVVLGAFDEKHNVGYADIDMGDIIEYVGTARPRSNDDTSRTNEKDLHMAIPNTWNQDPTCDKPTSATQAMFKSLETRTPVRVIRSHKMCDIVENKPVKGYRYDGLYTVIEATAMKEERQIWSFRMRRVPEELPAHGPLRGYADGAQRPDSRGRRPGHFSKR